jgi:HK97 family phage major capsid protein
MSFGMAVSGDKWEKRGDGTYERSINDLTLAEVSVVRNPAYVQSSIQARSLEVTSADELFLMQQNKKNDEGDMINMSKEKTLKELRAQMEALENEVKAEAVTAQVVEARNVETVDSKEVEFRALDQFIRKQDGEEIRTVTSASSPGSLTIPTHLSNFIVQKVTENAPLFARTKNFTPVNGFLEVLREQTIGNAGFVGEMTDLAKTDFTMDKIKLDQKRVGTAIELSQHLVNDSGIDVVGYAVNILGRRLGLTIDNSILTGLVASQFEGVMIDPGNSIVKVNTAGVGAITIDDLLDLYNSMNPHYQGEAVFVVSRATFNLISKLKDAQGQFYLIHDVANTGVTYRLFGRPVIINDAMPSPTAGMKAVLFANFSEGYATMTKQGLKLQHITGDTTQAMRGSHLLLLDGYMDGKILNPDAMKVLLIKAS